MRREDLASMKGLAPRTFGWLTIVATACIAAVVSHVALDVVGDVALAHDAYDDLPHASRGDTVALACALAVVACGCLLGLLVRAVRGSDRDLRAALAAASGRSPWRFVVGVGCTSAIVLAAMGFADALTSGRAVSLADAFGGSFALAAAIGIPIAAAMGCAVWLGIRMLLRSSGLLVAIVASFFAASDDPGPATLSRPHAPRTMRLVPVTTGNAGKRGPPIIR